MASFTARTTGEEVASLFAKEIQGRNILITGVTQGGIGAEVALKLSQHKPGLIILAGRNLSKIQITQDVIKSTSPGVSTRPLELDLSSQNKVRQAAEEVNGYEEPIDRLINNAAIMAAPYSKTEDGLESQFGTNHIGHFLFTNLIMPKILEAGNGSRIVNISSSGHKRGPVRFDDYNFENGAVYDKWKAYGQAKTANMLFSVALAQKLGPKGVQSYSLYPGRVLTNIVQNLSLEEMMAAGWVDEHGKIIPNPAMGWKTISEASATTIAAAFDPSIADKNGSYLVDCEVDMEAAATYAVDKDNAARLWALSEEIVGQKFEY